MSWVMLGRFWQPGSAQVELKAKQHSIQVLPRGGNWGV